MDRIRVKSVLTDGRVALWDRHPEHPGGEVFIADGEVHEVARTPAVEQRIRDGSLVVVPDVTAGEGTARRAPTSNDAFQPAPVPRRRGK